MVPPPAAVQLDRADSLQTIRTLRAYLNRREDDSAALFASQKSNRMIGTSINDYVVKRLAQGADERSFTYEGRGSPEEVSAHTLSHSVAWRMLRAEDGNTLYDVRAGANDLSRVENQRYRFVLLQAVHQAREVIRVVLGAHEIPTNVPRGELLANIA